MEDMAVSPGELRPVFQERLRQLNARVREAAGKDDNIMDELFTLIATEFRLARGQERCWHLARIGRPCPQ
jgi:hypothetical protein